MILSIEQITAILTDNPNKDVVTNAQKMRNRLFVHIYGEGLDEYLMKINSFENAQQYEARKKYACSNKDIFERIARPIDKIFTANGGSVFYDLPETKEQQFRTYLRNTENGLPLRKWVEQCWKSAYLADPMGLVFIEVNNTGEAYPTYKGSNEIYSYRLNGRNLDYVIFSVQNRKNVYRVVDDVFDYMIEFKDDKATILPNETYPNYFGYVPAIVNSDISVLGTEYYESPFDKIVEKADEYLRDSSVKSVFKLLHGFPKYWEYATQCPTCKGAGNVAGEECPSCKGTGIKLKTDISDTITLPVPEGKDDAVMAPNVAGYVSPPLETWVQMSEELKLVEQIMFWTVWGTKQTEDASNETATGRFIDTQPVNDRLRKFSDAAETIEKYITDALGQFYFGVLYKGSSVNYGRRFLVESSDALWKKYEEARKSGAPDTSLNDMLREYLQAKYEGSSMELMRQLKGLKLEPFPHLTANDVKNLEVAQIDYVKKVYYTDFVKTLTDNEIIFATLPTLQLKFDAFVEEKINIINQKKQEDEKARSKGFDPGAN